MELKDKEANQYNPLTELKDWIDDRISQIEDGIDEDSMTCCRQTELHTLNEILNKIYDLEVIK
jgi:hypothetical protein